MESMEAVDMEDISSNEDNVILNCCENHCFKDVIKVTLIVISSLVSLT